MQAHTLELPEADALQPRIVTSIELSRAASIQALLEVRHQPPHLACLALSNDDVPCKQGFGLSVKAKVHSPNSVLHSTSTGWPIRPQHCRNGTGTQLAFAGNPCEHVAWHTCLQGSLSRAQVVRDALHCRLLPDGLLVGIVRRCGQRRDRTCSAARRDDATQRAPWLGSCLNVGVRAAVQLELQLLCGSLQSLIFL